MKLDIYDIVEQTQTDIIRIKNNLELIGRVLQEGQGAYNIALPFKYMEAANTLDRGFVPSVRDPVLRLLEQRKAASTKEIEADPMIQRLDEIIRLLKEKKVGE